MRDSDVSFEEAVAEEYDRLSFNPAERDQRLLALRFFLLDLFQKVSHAYREPKCRDNLYVALANRMIDHWSKREGIHVMFVSLNYETVLEDALDLTYKRADGRLDAFIENEAFSVVKPHGSVEWFHVLDRMVVDVDEAYVRASEIEDESSYRLLWEPGNSPGGLFGPEFHRPALSLPHGTHKVALSAPPEHLEFLRNHIPSVRGLLIIGWSAHDDHVLEMIGPVLVRDIPVGIADPSHEAVNLQLQKHGSVARRLVTARSFKEFVFDTDQYADTALQTLLRNVK